MMAVYRIEIFDLDGDGDGMGMGYRVTGGGGLPLTCAGFLVCQLAETLSRIACNVDLPLPGPLPLGEGDRQPGPLPLGERSEGLGDRQPGPLPLGEGDRQPMCNLNRPWAVERGGLFTGEDGNNGDA